MLIDATHAEETRVVVLNGTRLEEFDVETSTKKQLKGNIYLAKVLRVEPSLQAAFVEYGGNRHGFLAFNEIHPDYYQIPVADRQALLAERHEVIRRSAAAWSADFGDGDAEDQVPAPAPAEGMTPEGAAEGQSEPETIEAGGASPEQGGDDTPNGSPAEEAEQVAAVEAERVETVGGDDAGEMERPRRRSLRNYKIQEVIKRRQILLVQVVKEERGNKGAALTTYLSLAGRYCVLMPNTARGGGVSRKITNATDRKRLKTIVGELDIPDGMAVIVRTAGSERTKPEIKRDYEYLLRLWDSVRGLTLKSTAPALVYEEANLIKRSIRDLYSRDIDEILVDGEEGYHLAKDFMRMLTPSHARRVQLFKEPAMPLFHKFQVEAQLDAMHSPVVQLKSGGYLVINQTEALVAIDVNSGRSTKERHIEETALKTNCEAADEVARQLRLRDLAGLIVIDFIDMEEPRNNHIVERRLKDAMRFDRARIQLGKISSFGLMELSRQRLRPSLIETSFQVCPHCNGTGLVRSVESAAVHLLRAIEEEGIRHRSSEVTVTTHPSIALYILNHKRADLAHIEAVYGFQVVLAGDESLVPPAHRMERVKAEVPVSVPAARPISADSIQTSDDEELPEDKEPVEALPVEVLPAEGGEEGDGAPRRRRRRRRRGRHGEDLQATGEGAFSESEETTDEPDALMEGEEGDEEKETIAVADGDPAPRRRRRGKRGGRRRNRNAAPLMASMEADGEPLDSPEEAALEAPDGAIETISEQEAVATPAEPVFTFTPDDMSEPSRSSEPAEPVGETAEEETASPEAVAEPVVASDPEAVPEPVAVVEPPSAEPAPKPKRTRAPRKKKVVETPESGAESGETATAEPAPKPKRTRAPRKKKVVETPESGAASGEPEVKEPEEAVASPVEAEPASVSEPANAPEEEPVFSPVVLTGTEDEEEVQSTIGGLEEPGESDAFSAPRRKGWWNRSA